MDNYFIKANFNRNEKGRYIESYELYKNNSRTPIKTIDIKTSNLITESINKGQVELKQIGFDHIIDDIDYIKKYIKLPSMILQKNKYAGKIVVLSSMLTASIIASINKFDDNTVYAEEKPIESNIEDANTEEITNNDITETTTEEKIEFDDLNTSMYYHDTTEMDYNNYPISEEKLTTENNSQELIDENINDVNTITNFNSNNTLSFSYDDLENQDFMENIMNLYGDSIKKYSEKYGIDSKLIAAIIAQENPHSVRGEYAAGLMQVERSVWNGVTVRDIDGSDLYIDCNLIDNDPDYGIHAGCYIFWFTYEKIINDNKNNQFNFSLNDEECLAIAISSYNKSVYSVEPCLMKTNNIEEAYEAIRNIPYGDDYYREKILSGLDNNTVLTMNTSDGIKEILVKNNYLEETKAK